jgi:Fic family protein
LESFLEEQTVTIQQLEEKTGAPKQTIHKQISELEQIFSFRLKKYRNTFYLQNKEMISYTTISIIIRFNCN